MKSWVAEQTKDGRYSNVSDYMRDLIRRDQNRQTAIASLQAGLNDGLESGTAKPFDMSAFIASKAT